MTPYRDYTTRAETLRDRKEAIESIKDIGIECASQETKGFDVAREAANSLYWVIVYVASREIATSKDLRFTDSRMGQEEHNWFDDPARDEALTDALHSYMDLIAWYHGDGFSWRPTFAEQLLQSFLGAQKSAGLISSTDPHVRNIIRQEVVDRARAIAKSEAERYEREGGLDGSSHIVKEASDVADKVEALLNKNPKERSVNFDNRTPRGTNE